MAELPFIGCGSFKGRHIDIGGVPHVSCREAEMIQTNGSGQSNSHILSLIVILLATLAVIVITYVCICGRIELE